MLQDLQYAIRNLRNHRLIGAVAILTLGLGIGAATAVFSVVDAVLLRPLPFSDPGRLVRIHGVTPDGAAFSLADGDYLELASDPRRFQGVAAFRPLGASRVIAGSGDAERIVAMPISASAANVLGVQPALGRFFAAQEDKPRAEGRIVLSHGLWQRRFAGDATIIGQAVVLDDRPFTVTGVMPRGFDFPDHADAWVPLAADPGRSRDDKELEVFARLSTGTTVAAARADLRTFAQRLAREHPEANAGWSADLLPFDEWLVAPRFRDAVWVLFGAVALLLLLACANVANLLVAHATTREGEMRIRSALGASRLRLARQAFTESALLAALGTFAGVLMAFWSVDAVQAIGGGRVPRLEDVRVSATVLRFACLAGALSCLVFGSAPALRGARTPLRHAMDEGTRYTTGSRRLRYGLVVIEVALALLLVVGASLLASSFARLMHVESGFDPAGVVTMSIELPGSRYPEDRVAPFYADLLDRVRGIPGVTAVGATSTDPFRQFGFSNSVTPEERAHQAPASGLMQAGWRSVSPGFFETMRIPVLAGRTFSTADRQEAPRVVVISRSLADTLWPGQDAVGRRIYWGGTTGRTRTVIGVTGDVRDLRLEAAASPMLFLPHAQVDLPAMTLVVRSALGGGIASSLRSAVREMDAGLPAAAVNDLQASRSGSAAGARFNLWLLGAIAAIALALALTGVFATMAFTVAERRREIAVRLALGASPASIVGLILRSGLTVAVLGIAVGTASALASTKILTSLLFEVAPTDPLSFAAGAAVLLATAAFACYLPARGAASVDPLTILRD